MSELWLVFLTGLMGSAHCVGMCGGFVLMIQAPNEVGNQMVRQTAYFIGKTFTYMMLIGRASCRKRVYETMRRSSS